MSLYNVEL